VDISCSIAHIPQNRWAWILKGRMEETHQHVRKMLKVPCTDRRNFMTRNYPVTCGLPFRPQLIL
jgi:hypothetical protein